MKRTLKNVNKSSQRFQTNNGWRNQICENRVGWLTDSAAIGEIPTLQRTIQFFQSIAPKVTKAMIDASPPTIGRLRSIALTPLPTAPP